MTHFFKIITQPGFPKTFLDVGCNHPIKHNNSLFFERYMGFRVLGIDALPTYCQSWLLERPTAELVISAVGNEKGVIEFEETENNGHEEDMFSSISGVSNKARMMRHHTRTIPITTLTEILAKRELHSIGIMSIDIEGYELQALKGLDLEMINIQIIILENNSKNVLGCDDIRTYLIEKGFSYVARIWGMDDVFLFRNPIGGK